MKNAWKPWIVVLLALAALTVVAAGIGTWALLNELGSASTVLRIDDETIELGAFGAMGATAVGVAVAAAVAVTVLAVLVVVPGVLVLALLCTVLGLAIGALALLGTAALFLLPVLLPLALGWWWWRSQRTDSAATRSDVPAGATTV